MRLSVHSSKNSKTKTKPTNLALFISLASVLVLSSVSVAQLVANSNAYAQSRLSVTGDCILDGAYIRARFTIFGGDGSLSTRYYQQVLDSSGDVLFTDGTFSLPGQQSYHFGYGTDPGEQITYNIYHDVDNDYRSVGVEEDELVGSHTVTCPSYTDLFRNQGQCIRFAGEYDGGDITKSGCQEAF